MNKIFDLNLLKREFSDSTEILQEAFSLFKQLSPEMLNAIEKSFNEKNWKGLNHAAHTLKGSVSNLGGYKVQQSALKIEKAAETNDIDLIKSEIEILKKETNILCDAIDNFDVSIIS